MPPPDPNEALRVLLACFLISAIGGFFALLRSSRLLTLREVIAATCYSGALGLTIGLLWYKTSVGEANLYFLIGVCGLAGLGGTTLVDFVLHVVRQGGVNVNITTRDVSPEPDQPDQPDQPEQPPEPPSHPPRNARSVNARGVSPSNPPSKGNRGSSISRRRPPSQ